jgi:dishevelled associated activator of morphogenesis
MSFINSVICGGPGEDIAFRMHIRFEFIALGIIKMIDKISFVDNEVLQTQIDVFIAGLEDDEMAIFGDAEIDINAEQGSKEIAEKLSAKFQNTSAEPSYLSILQHLSILPDNPIDRFSLFIN